MMNPHEQKIEELSWHLDNAPRWVRDSAWYKKLQQIVLDLKA